jgi:DNA-directed RNA polymerase beta' subunit
MGLRYSLLLYANIGIKVDGDEMNVHSPLTIEARAELATLADVEGMFLSSQASTCNISIVQDGVLGTYIMTKRWLSLPKHVFQQLINHLFTFTFTRYNAKLEHIKRVYEELDYPLEQHLYTGKTVFSFMLPDDFNYHKKNGADMNEPIVKIKNGVLLEGAINKSQLSGGHYSIMHLLAKEYSVQTAMDFVNDVQFIANEFLLWFGFSTGLNDCLVRHKPEDLEKIIIKGYLEAEENEKNIKNKDIREAQISNVLTKTKNIGMNVAKKIIVEQGDILESGPDSNNFVHLVTSGSKGSYFNIALITTWLGQQSMGGGRIEPQLENGRTLVHYPFGKLDNEKKYESRGFVRHSFIHGLNPQEFFMHAIVGRIGVIDTALKTSSSGYTQRKCVKVCEDITVKYDSTVRDINNKIIQFSYGDTDLDGQKTIMVDDEMQFVNISRLAEQMNSQHEIKHHIL